jgi:hypothetical protein
MLVLDLCDTFRDWIKSPQVLLALIAIVRADSRRCIFLSEILLTGYQTILEISFSPPSRRLRGHKRGEDMIEQCETCEGKGWVDDPSDGGTMTCPECGNEYGESDDDSDDTEPE